jgi:hypothetical protein
VNLRPKSKTLQKWGRHIPLGVEVQLVSILKTTQYLIRKISMNTQKKEISDVHEAA